MSIAGYIFYGTECKRINANKKYTSPKIAASYKICLELRYIFVVKQLMNMRQRSNLKFLTNPCHCRKSGTGVLSAMKRQQ